MPARILRHHGVIIDFAPVAWIAEIISLLGPAPMPILMYSKKAGCKRRLRDPLTSWLPASGILCLLLVVNNYCGATLREVWRTHA